MGPTPCRKGATGAAASVLVHLPHGLAFGALAAATGWLLLIRPLGRAARRSAQPSVEQPAAVAVESLSP
jgi:hypothetical protein